MWEGVRTCYIFIAPLNSSLKVPTVRVKGTGRVNIHAGTTNQVSCSLKARCAPSRLHHCQTHPARVSHSSRGIWEITDWR